MVVLACSSSRSSSSDLRWILSLGCCHFFFSDTLRGMESLLRLEKGVWLERGDEGGKAEEGEPSPAHVAVLRPVRAKAANEESLWVADASGCKSSRYDGRPDN
jgi:hypothetical protein